MDMKVTASLLVDGLSAGYEIESLLGEYLEPLPVAAYLPGQAEPVFTMGEHYYQYVNGELQYITKIEDIQSDIYRNKDELVFEFQHLARLLPKPDIPVIGMSIVREMIDVMLRRHARWTRKRVKPAIESDEDSVFSAMRESQSRVELKNVIVPVHHDGPPLVDPGLVNPMEPTAAPAKDTLWNQEELRKHNQHAPYLGAILHDFLKFEYKWVRNNERLIMDPTTGIAVGRLEPNHELRQNLSIHLMDLRSRIAKFLGDDNWIMHFVEEVGNDFVIRKTIDYRIWSWEREHGDEYE